MLSTSILVFRRRHVSKPETLSRGKKTESADLTEDSQSYSYGADRRTPQQQQQRRGQQQQQQQQHQQQHDVFLQAQDETKVWQQARNSLKRFTYGYNAEIDTAEQSHEMSHEDEHNSWIASGR